MGRLNGQTATICQYEDKNEKQSSRSDRFHLMTYFARILIIIGGYGAKYDFYCSYQRNSVQSLIEVLNLLGLWEGSSPSDPQEERHNLCHGYSF